MREVGQLGDVGCNLPRFIACEISPDQAAGSDVQTLLMLPRYCRGPESERQSRPELKIGATKFVQRESSWLLAALAQLRLAHSCLRLLPAAAGLWLCLPTTRRCR